MNVSSGAHAGQRLEFDDLHERARLPARSGLWPDQAGEHPVHPRARPPARGERSDGQRGASRRGRDRTALRLHGMPAGRRSFGTTPDRGAEPILYLAASPEVAGVSGRYFDRCTETRSSAASYDEAAARRLWEESCAWWDMIRWPTRRGPANLRHAHLLLPLQRLRHRVRAARPHRHQGHLSRMPGPQAGAADVAHRRPASAGKPADFSRLGPPATGGCCGGSCHTHQH